jgi:hypothetical protein
MYWECRGRGHNSSFPGEKKKECPGRKSNPEFSTRNTPLAKATSRINMEIVPENGRK